MGVFLSYRRVDSAYALWIYPWLIQWLGRDRVFWDRKDIDPGQPFAAVIESQIRASGAFIALISSNWLGAVDAAGRRRIDAQDDWVRRETTLALQLAIPVLPVLVGGMKAPAAAELPEPLQGLARLHMFSMADMSFHDTLRETLERTLAVQPAPRAAADSRLQRRAASLLQRQAWRLQVRAVELIQECKLDRAQDELSEGMELLMTLLDLLPGDAALDAQLGYLFGTTGQALKRAGELQLAERYFDLALSVFERGRQAPDLLPGPFVTASDIKGIGGVYYERGDPMTAIAHYRSALALEPRYSAAWHDLFAAYDLLARRGAINTDRMREAIDRARETGAGLPGLGQDKFDRFERMLAGWQQQAAQHPHLQTSDGAARIVPLALMAVISQARPHHAAFNLDCMWIHQVVSFVTVRRLVLEVRHGRRRVRRFAATSRFQHRPSDSSSGRSMVADGAVDGIELQAGSHTLGFHFTEVDAIDGPFWPAGTYALELRAWTEPAATDEPQPQPALITRFAVKVGRYEAGQGSQWALAPPAQWARLNDADGAVGVPLQIDHGSVSTSA